MPKLFVRFIALLLSIGLVTDPVAASVFTTPHPGAAINLAIQKSISQRFNQEALAAFALTHERGLRFLRNNGPAVSGLLVLAITAWIFPEHAHSGAPLVVAMAGAEAYKRPLEKTSPTVRRMKQDQLRTLKGWNQLRVHGLDRMERMYGSEVELLKSREFIAAAIADIHQIDIQEGADMEVFIDGTLGESSRKKFTIVTARIDGKDYPLGILAGEFWTGEIEDRARIGLTSVGPRIGPFVDEHVLAVQPIFGPTLRQLVDSGDWRSAFQAQLEVIFELANLGLIGSDINNWNNIIREKSTGQGMTVDSGSLGSADGSSVLLSPFIKFADQRVETYLIPGSTLRSVFEHCAADVAWMAETAAHVAWARLGPSALILLTSGAEQVASHKNWEEKLEERLHLLRPVFKETLMVAVARLAAHGTPERSTPGTGTPHLHGLWIAGAVAAGIPPLLMMGLAVTSWYVIPKTWRTRIGSEVQRIVKRVFSRRAPARSPSAFLHAA